MISPRSNDELGNKLVGLCVRWRLNQDGTALSSYVQAARALIEYAKGANDHGRTAQIHFAGCDYVITVEPDDWHDDPSLYRVFVDSECHEQFEHNASPSDDLTRVFGGAFEDIVETFRAECV